MMMWMLYIAAMVFPVMLVWMLIELLVEKRNPDLHDKWMRIVNKAVRLIRR